MTTREAEEVLRARGSGEPCCDLAACGDDEPGGGNGTTAGGGGGAGGETGVPWILGTTDTVTALDPAGSYDLGSSTLEYNLYQTLVTVPANSTEIVGDAAEGVRLRRPADAHLHAQGGPEVLQRRTTCTSSDVKYSFERSITIQDPNGAAIYLLGSITDTAEDGTVTLNEGAIETPDDTTVVFHLDQPDTTFQYVLTYPGAGAIVDEETFPADEKLADEEIIGSGPYKLSQYKAGDQAVLEVNENYTGENTGQAPQVFVKYYSEPSALKLAAENGEVDVAWRSLSPTDIADLEGNDDVTVATGEGSEIRYWVWKVDGPRSASRRRSARPRPRSSTARRSPRTPTTAPSTRCTRSCRRATPAQNDAFKDEVRRARRRQGRSRSSRTPASRPRSNLTVGWTPTHYGPSTEDEANEVERQLEDSGLFDVDPEEHRVGAVPDHLQGGRLRPLHPRLVPRLPGR